MTDLEDRVVPEPGGGPAPTSGDPTVVREVLAGLPGSVVFLQPVYGPGGEVTDFLLAAASPEAVDVGGRRGAELLGRTVLQTYPGTRGTELWEGYLTALGGTRHEGETEYLETAAGIPHRSRWAVRAVPCQGGLLVSWNRLDQGEREERRLALMQRLGRMGWLDRDLTRDEVTWSEEAYSIFDREPSEGPLRLEELALLAEGEDRRLLVEEVRRLLASGEPIDRTFRIRLPRQEVRHVRVVAESETDAHGRPVRLHGLFQDRTAAERTQRQLLEHRQAVLSHQSQLAAERDIAARLQETLLPAPQQVLHLGGLTVDIAYRPVQEGLNLGGDWYSAIELPDGRVLLVVGDVAGHGLDAVATMALLRFTAKGMAVTGTPLPTVLANLNTLLLHTSERQFNTATLVMAAYEPATSRLTWVRAGHPPPLLLRGGEARFLPSPDGILLGVAEAPGYQAATLDLLPGDHLLLYTDGLVEHPGEPIDEGLARLARTAESHAGAPAFVDGLVRALQDGRERRDDICVLHISR
ncbi:PP2C family protein-serine/threonine phosphatase [Kitasatospora sp. NPDC051853]|uniref:PP2C family protein-serine/threonine phosphatase n=1 Tax=Kitasatospora sp. NPDC051853 TaxID=3364058 RepID=UPI00379775CC